MAVIASHRLQRIGAEDVYDSEDDCERAFGRSAVAPRPSIKRIETETDAVTAGASSPLVVGPTLASSPQPSFFSADFMQHSQDVKVCSGTGLTTHTSAKALIAMPAQEVRWLAMAHSCSGVACLAQACFEQHAKFHATVHA